MKPRTTSLPHRRTPKRRPNRFGHNALKIETLPIRDLRANPNNSRLHPRTQIEKLRRAIEEFGFLIPVLIDERNTTISGHARIEAAERCGLTAVPCVRANHLSEAQKRAFIISDNRLAEDARWDFQVLAKEFEFLRLEGMDLETTGFEIPELDMVFAAADNAASPEDDKIPDLQPTRTITKPHDFWTMGDHRLICADARRPESFVQLLSGHKADLVFVDPPYNVRIRGHVSGNPSTPADCGLWAAFFAGTSRPAAPFGIPDHKMLGARRKTP